MTNWQDIAKEVEFEARVHGMSYYLVLWHREEIVSITIKGDMYIPLSKKNKFRIRGSFPGEFKIEKRD